jgi:hypothetical protein
MYFACSVDNASGASCPFFAQEDFSFWLQQTRKALT